MITGRDTELAERLRKAAAEGRTKAVVQLLEDGASFSVDTEGQTALHQAAQAGHQDTVAALILGGCDVGIQDFSGHTALQKAAAEGHVEIVRQLLKQGASVDHQDEVHGNTALHEAAWKGFSQTVSVLCKAKANFYIKNRGGFAPLHLCCQNGHNESCRVLLLHGCKPDLKNNYGDTPLHTSARYGHAGVIRILVSAKCNVSEQNKNGDTALHIAAAMGRRKLTKILLESACDKDSQNKQSETAIDISRRKNLVDIIGILQNPPPILSQQDREDQADRDRTRERGSKADKKREKTSTSSKENDGGFKRDKKRSRHSKERTAEESGALSSPYGCHNDPDMDEFPLPRMNSMPDDPLRAGEQYFLDLGGNIKKGPISKMMTCYCAPAFDKFEKKLERDKKELLKHIDSSHTKLDTKISHLERKTRDQLFNLNQSMKESFALERGECLDRMDRRALRERIAIERQQAVRDVSLKRDLASWLDKKLQEIEVKHGSDTKNASVLRSLALRSAGRAQSSEESGGERLRRALSEELLSEVGLSEEPGQSQGVADTESLYKGLKVSDKPSTGSRRVRRNSAGDNPPPLNLTRSQEERERMILNQSTASESYLTPSQEERERMILSHSTASESYHDTSHSDRETVEPGLPVRLIRPIPMCYSSENLPTHPNLIQGEPNKPPAGYQASSDNQNYHFPGQMNPIRRFTTEADIHHATPLLLDSPTTSSPSSSLPPYRAPPHPIPTHLYHPRDRLPRPGPLLPPVDEDEYVPLEEKEQDLHRQLLNLPLQSDVGSHDSHNDSGYSTRLGASAGPSPSLSGSRPGSTDGEGYHVGQPGQVHGEAGGPGSHCSAPAVGPKIRALQHQLKLTDINDAKGSLV